MRRKISRHEQIRRARGYTITRLAREIGVSHSYVSLVEGGLEKPSPRYREAVSAALGVHPEVIFDPEEVSDEMSGRRATGGATQPENAGDPVP
jgi:transcriptional regulator with XRE-family HTH domain